MVDPLPVLRGPDQGPSFRGVGFSGETVPGWVERWRVDRRVGVRIGLIEVHSVLALHPVPGDWSPVAGATVTPPFGGGGSSG